MKDKRTPVDRRTEEGQSYWARPYNGPLRDAYRASSIMKRECIAYWDQPHLATARDAQMALSLMRLLR